MWVHDLTEGGKPRTMDFKIDNPDKVDVGPPGFEPESMPPEGTSIPS